MSSVKFISTFDTQKERLFETFKNDYEMIKWLEELFGNYQKWFEFYARGECVELRIQDIAHRRAMGEPCD